MSVRTEIGLARQHLHAAERKLDAMQSRINAEAIAAILMDGNPLHLAWSEQHRIPAVAEKIAAALLKDTP